VTSTKELGKILAAMHSVKISGSPNFVSAIQIAQVPLSPLWQVVNSSWRSNIDRISYRNNESLYLLLHPSKNHPKSSCVSLER
jgi:hypothetical protein